MQQILWIVFAICCAWPTLLKATPLTVIIDAGHGGIDNGATKNGHQEAEINLQVSRHLTDLLKKDRRFKVHMTRTDNRTLSLAERASLADKRSADVFLSIHVNSNPDSRARGAEFYFQNQLPPDEQSMYLAHKENAAETEGHTGIKYDFIEQRSLAPEVSSIVTDLLDGHRIFRSSQLAKSLKISWSSSKSGAGNCCVVPRTTQLR